MAEQKKKPPYTSATDLDRLFERMRTLGDPGTIDTKWVGSYGLAGSQPEGVVAALKWLGVVDKDGKSTGVWNKLRVPATRQETLTKLVEDSYAEIFSRIDVEAASRQDLEGAFISAYDAGNPGRLIKCFLALCDHAGITTSAATHRSPKSAPAAKTEKTQKASKPRLKTESNGATKRARTGGDSSVRNIEDDRATDAAVRLTLNVEIPADWSDDQVRARIKAVREAASGA